MGELARLDADFLAGQNWGMRRESYMMNKVITEIPLYEDYQIMEYLKKKSCSPA